MTNLSHRIALIDQHNRNKLDINKYLLFHTHILLIWEIDHQQHSIFSLKKKWRSLKQITVTNFFLFYLNTNCKFYNKMTVF